VSADAAPEVNMTQAAALALQEVVKKQAPEGHTLHLQIDARFSHHLHLAPPMPGEIAIEGPGLTLYFDLQSASRADGIRIDVVEGEGGTGFHIENPNAPQVHPLAPADLRQWLGDDRRFEIIDVRSPEERALASLDGSVLLTSEEAQRIESLPRDTTLVFYCKSGVRSQQAAETFSRKGFGDVHNLVGGLDAWLESSEA
jgi:monothiol glutaredoxin